MIEDYQGIERFEAPLSSTGQPMPENHYQDIEYFEVKPWRR